MTIYDGKNAFGASKGVSSLRLNQTVVWRGTALPVLSANQVPQNGLFLLVDSLSAPTTKTWYIQTSATIGVPVFVVIPEAVVAGQSGDQVYPLNKTIGEYSIPSAALGGAGADAVWGDLHDQIIENFETYATQGAADADWISADTAKTRANISGNHIDWDLEDNLANSAHAYFDLGSNLSDTKWILRFKWRMNTKTLNSRTWFGISSDTADQDTAKDFIGMVVHSDPSNIANWELMETDGETLPFSGQSTAAAAATATDYWIEIIRTSATGATMNIYSNSTYTTLIESETITVPATTVNLRYVWLGNRNDLESANGQVGLCDDYEIWDGVSSIPSVANTIDNNTATGDTISTAMNIDMGSLKDPASLALYLDLDLTTETEIELHASVDQTFTSPELVRTILVSDFTDETWRFLSIPGTSEAVRYIQITPKNGGDLRIMEIKYKAVTNWDRRHFHKFLDPTSTTGNSLDSN